MKKVLVVILLCTTVSIFSKKYDIEEGDVEITYLDQCKSHACCYVKRARKLLDAAKLQLFDAKDARGVDELFQMVNNAHQATDAHVTSVCDTKHSSQIIVS